MGKIDNIYSLLPIWAQHLAVSTYGSYWYWIRFGPGYKQYVKAYQERENKFTSNDWQNWQLQALTKILTLCACHVPYYRDSWGESEKRAAHKGHIGDIPFLEKDTVRANPRMLVRDDIVCRRPLTFYTSGTTGTPISSIWTVQELRESLAFHEVRGANCAGVSFRMPRATFSGRIVEPNITSKGPYYRYNFVERQIYFSAFHLSPHTAPMYVKALQKFRPEWLTGYAVSHYLLAQMIREQGLKPPPIKSIITTSEKLTASMRTVLEDAYHCRVYEEYNTVENVLFANDCEYGRLHVSPDVGLIEILRPDGTPCDPGEVGEVVATCFFRTYQPYIRYRVGDLAAWDDKPCPCGRKLPVIKEVVGRIEDVLLGPDGRQLVRFHGVFINQPHVKQGQLIQEDLDRIRVLVVPTNGFDNQDIVDIIRRVQYRVGSEVNVLVEPVDSIPRTASGKYQAVISRIISRDALKAEQNGGY